MFVLIIDYGSGNIKSVYNSVKKTLNNFNVSIEVKVSNNMLNDTFSEILTCIRNALRLKSYGVEVYKTKITKILSKILLKDPALKALDEEAKPNDVVEVHRFSESAGSNLAYRLVVEE